MHVFIWNLFRVRRRSVTLYRLTAKFLLDGETVSRPARLHSRWPLNSAIQNIFFIINQCAPCRSNNWSWQIKTVQFYPCDNCATYVLALTSLVWTRFNLVQVKWKKTASTGGKQISILLKNVKLNADAFFIFWKFTGCRRSPRGGDRVWRRCYATARAAEAVAGASVVHL